MLWDAGQERTVREGRSRLTELYVAMSDAIVGTNVRAGVWKSSGYRSPSYTRDEAAPGRNDLSRLVADVGGTRGASVMRGAKPGRGPN